MLRVLHCPWHGAAAKAGFSDRPAAPASAVNQKYPIVPLCPSRGLPVPGGPLLFAAVPARVPACLFKCPMSVPDTLDRERATTVYRRCTDGVPPTRARPLPGRALLPRGPSPGRALSPRGPRPADPHERTFPPAALPSVASATPTNRPRKKPAVTGSCPVSRVRQGIVGTTGWTPPDPRAGNRPTPHQSPLPRVPTRSPPFAAP